MLVCISSLFGCSSAPAQETKNNTTIPVESTPSVTESQKPTELSKDEMLANAQEITIIDLLSEINANPVRAKKTYEGKIYKVSGCIVTMFFNDGRDRLVTKIDRKDSNLILGALQVYLNEDDLLKVNEEDKITVVGKISVVKDSLNVYMDNAYLVENSK